ncbi:MAG: helix-turn-helix transcriptional regulator [Clostridia bacterium]|nr:helix-turn-helix transcriptional regulator [Clostridia bacterium]
MNIGKTIKRLRREQNMTQEKLADYLNISPQAVSRWENGLAMPDLHLIPIIANLFEVTTDLLFGLDNTDVNAAIEIIIQKSADLESAQDKNEKSLSLLRNGVAKYPNNWLMKSELVQKLYTTYAAYHAELEPTFLDEAVKLCEEILDNCTVDNYRYSTIEILSAIYSSRGETDKALAVVNRFPSSCITADKIRIALCRDNEKIDLIKDNIITYTDALCQRLRALAFCDAYSAEEKIVLLNKIVGIYGALLENEADRGTELMCDVHRYASVIYAELGDTANTIKELDASVTILEKLLDTPTVSPSLIRREYGVFDTIDKTETTDVYYLAEELLYKLGHKRYAFLIEDADFISLLERLEYIVG